MFESAPNVVRKTGPYEECLKSQTERAERRYVQYGDDEFCSP